MTANAITPRLPLAFLSRLEIVEVSAPPLAEFDALFAQVLRSLAHRWALPPEIMPSLPTRAIK